MFREAPTTLQCPSCGYSLAGIDFGTCPECGSTITDQHAVASKALHALVRRRGVILKRAAIVHSSAVVVVATLAGLLQHSAQVGLMFLVAGVVLVTATTALGMLPVMIVEPWRREPVALMWFRSLWWLHLVWMVAPLVVVLLVVLQLGTAATSASRVLTVEDLAAPVIIVTPPWATLLLTSVLVWWGEWGDTAKLIASRRRVRATTALAAVISALMGGAFAAVFAFVALEGLVRWIALWSD